MVKIWAVTISDYLLMVIDFACISVLVLSWCVYERLTHQLTHKHAVIYTLVFMASLLGFIWSVKLSDNSMRCEDMIQNADAGQ